MGVMAVKSPEGHGKFAEDLIFAVINWVPLWARVWGCQNLGAILYYLDERHRRIALRNLAIAFPQKSEKERKALALAAFRHLGRVIGESSFIPRLTPQNIRDYVVFEGLENYQRVKEQGRGIVFLTAHFGNWEWMASAFPLFTGRPAHVIFRPLDNPFFDRVVERLRTWTGNQGVPKQKSMGRIMRLLRSGEMVGILLDQNVAWQEGVFVKFFGELACTNEGLALLALKTGAAILPAFNVRERGGRYRVIIESEIPLIRTGDKMADVQKNTELFTSAIERYVREYPDHWLWVHQRWKTRPWQAKRVKGAAEFPS
jgi:Kdo2-lipid IVA lauroyltransferase/acyltransferase